MSPAQNPALLRALAAEIKHQRNILKISQDELAYRAGLNRTFLGKIEVAKNQPSLSALLKLSVGLNICMITLVAAIMARYAKEVSIVQLAKPEAT
jgi:predicted transcriptional regulator